MARLGPAVLLAQGVVSPVSCLLVASGSMTWGWVEGRSALVVSKSWLCRCLRTWGEEVTRNEPRRSAQARVAVSFWCCLQHSLDMASCHGMTGVLQVCMCRRPDAPTDGLTFSRMISMMLELRPGRDKDNPVGKDHADGVC